MRSTIQVVVAAMAVWAPMACGQDELISAFAGQDLHMSGGTLTMSRQETSHGRHTLVFEDGVHISIGSNAMSAQRAVVWIEPQRREHRGRAVVSYRVVVYLREQVWAQRGPTGLTSGLDTVVVDQGEALAAAFEVTGELFVTALQRREVSPAETDAHPLVAEATSATAPLRSEPEIPVTAQVPTFPPPVGPAPTGPQVARPWRISDLVQPSEPPGPGEPVAPTPAPSETYEYPVNFVDLWKPAPTIESTVLEDGSRVTTVIGRFYLWQQRDEAGAILEFQADSAVVFHGGQDFGPTEDHGSTGIFASGNVDAVYLKGNIVMTEGRRTIRADEVYYDFRANQALAVQAEMRTFDEQRGLPIYIRAEQLRQVSQTVFEAENITLTTSEFYLPQVSLTAGRLVLTDRTNVDARVRGGTRKSSYDGVLHDVGLRVGETQVFAWPKVRTNFERPDTALRRVRIGDDSDLGFAVETRWYLARLLGRPEPEGVDSTFALDFYSERGIGSGAEIEYEGNDYYGSLLGYIMGDRGEDDLGRITSRKNRDPHEDIRGRFRLRHRQYLPHDWQATVEMSYLSDEHFLEAMYPSEFNVGKEQETVVHLKRITDNWGFSFLTKWRLNDFQRTTEELPGVEFHVKGQSFWDHQLTYYGDTQVSRLRERLPWHSTDTMTREQFYSFASSRHEVDWPLRLEAYKIVPYVATTYAYEDGQYGFRRTLDGALTPGEKDLWLNEAGIRVATMFWKANQFVRSRFWDLNGIRHIIRPHFEAVTFDASHRAGDMRDMMNFGLSQRWQTRRGEKDKLRSLDWMRLDVDATFVRNPDEPAAGPAKFMWNDPAIPMLVRRNMWQYGLVRDSVNVDYEWRISDTMTVLSDLNYDLRAGTVQQFDMGLARYVYPNLSYYVGNRYLKPVVINWPADGVYEQGSNALVAAVTYQLNERYTATLSQEYNFDFGKGVRSDLTLLRRYHRLYYGLTISLDQSRDRQSVMVSIWPEGVKELALGSRKYVGITGPLLEE